MAGGIAHELNSPLAAISSGLDRCELLLSKNEVNLEKIKKTNKKLISILPSIFRITKNLEFFSGSNQNQEYVEINIRDMFDDILAYIHDYCSETQIDIQLKCDNINLNCQKSSLVQVFIYLLKQRIIYLEILDKNIDINIQGNDNNLSIIIKDKGLELDGWMIDFIEDKDFIEDIENKGSTLEITLLKDTLKNHKAHIQFYNEGIYQIIEIVFPKKGLL